MQGKNLVIIDYGSQYTLNIKARLRELGFNAEILPFDASKQDLGRPAGIILSGGPHSVYEEGAPQLSQELISLIFELDTPTLGLCYGMQLIAHHASSGHYQSVIQGQSGEYGKYSLCIMTPIGVLEGLEETQQVWMSHGDLVVHLPSNFQRLDFRQECLRTEGGYYPIKAIKHIYKPLFGLQFHPEVHDTHCGDKILLNFAKICGLEPNWSLKDELERIEQSSIEALAGKQIEALVSMGKDSSVLVYFLEKISPEENVGFYYVLGLGPDEDLEKIQLTGKKFEIINAREDFYHALSGVIDPEEKRNSIAQVYLQLTRHILAEAALKAHNAGKEIVVAQGTIYPDVIESGLGNSAKIKAHHNSKLRELLEGIGVEPDNIFEPFSSLFKPEVQTLGESLGVPKSLRVQHPWPGPGYAVRFLCSKPAHLLADPLFREAMQVETPLQIMCQERGYRAFVLPIKSTGVQGDKESYAYTAALIGPYDFRALAELATQIPNSLKGKINRVTYVVAPRDTTSLIDLHAHEDYFDEHTHGILKTLNEDILIPNLRLANLYQETAQAFVVLAPLSFANGGYTAIIRAVDTQDFMTCTPSRLPEQFLIKTANDVLAQVPKIQLVLYDLTSKPPGTIEWE